jgi:hypothetical protein
VSVQLQAREIDKTFGGGRKGRFCLVWTVDVDLS